MALFGLVLCPEGATGIQHGVSTRFQPREPSNKRFRHERRNWLGSNLNIRFFGYLLDLLLKIPINLQSLLESGDRRVDGRIFKTAGKFAHLQSVQ